MRLPILQLFLQSIQNHILVELQLHDLCKLLHIKHIHLQKGVLYIFIRKVILLQFQLSRDLKQSNPRILDQEYQWPQEEGDTFLFFTKFQHD